MWHFTWKNCGISLGRIVVNTILFDIHKNYIVMNNSRVFAVISIFQRTLFLLGNAERCGQRSCFFRLKVRGERLKAGGFYRFALNYFYVVRPKGGGPKGIKRQFKSILFVNYCQFFPFCGLEECAMHIDNPQMRGLFFCGVTRHVCRGYDRLRILGELTPKCTP